MCYRENTFKPRNTRKFSLNPPRSPFSKGGSSIFICGVIEFKKDTFIVKCLRVAVQTLTTLKYPEPSTGQLDEQGWRRCGR